MSATSRTYRHHLLTHRHTYRHWMPEQVRWSDTDQAGHVNNLAFATYCETGRTHFLHPIIDRRADPRIFFVVAQQTINFLGEVHWPAIIDAGTGLLTFGSSSCRLAHGLFDGERCVATAETVLVAIDEATRQPREIPEWTRDFLYRFQIDTASAGHVQDT